MWREKLLPRRKRMGVLACPRENLPAAKEDSRTNSGKNFNLFLKAKCGQEWEYRIPGSHRHKLHSHLLVRSSKTSHELHKEKEKKKGWVGTWGLRNPCANVREVNSCGKSTNFCPTHFSPTPPTEKRLKYLGLMQQMPAAGGGEQKNNPLFLELFAWTIPLVSISAGLLLLFVIFCVYFS